LERNSWDGAFLLFGAVFTKQKVRDAMDTNDQLETIRRRLLEGEEKAPLPADLERILLDKALDETGKEHAFYAYWKRQLEEKDSLSRAEFTILLSFPQWMYGPIGTIIKNVCERGNLSAPDAEWLIGVIPKDTFARDQVKAHQRLNDTSLRWQDKLQSAIDLNAYWAAEKVLEQVPFDGFANALEITSKSKQSRRLRNFLLERKKRVKQG
jgi:hypothetical protein